MENEKELLIQRGKRIRAWRVVNGITKEALAKRVGVTIPTVSAWEEGKIIAEKYIAALKKKGEVPPNILHLAV